MRLVLFVLASGDALPIGLGLLAVGALVAFARPTIGASVGLCGIVLAAASAVPPHAALYVALAFAFAVWVAFVRRSPRVRRISTALLVVVLAVVSTALVLDNPSPPSRSTDDRPVFVLGDSLSAGLGARGEGTWPTVLANQIRRPVRSFARPGARLADGLVQADALPPGDCVVLIELGGNDILGDATVESFAGNLRRLLRSVTKGNRSVLMFELPLLPLQNRYGRIQRQAGTEFGVRLIPRRVLAGAVTLPGHTTDGLHLSAAGHQWLAGKVAKWL